MPLEHARELAPLPVDALPPWLAQVTTELAHAYQVPPEMPAMYALALVGGAIAGRYVVTVRDGWTMPPTLYVCVALPPSERKTPIVRTLAQPLREHERELAQRIAGERETAIAAAKQARAVEAGLLRRLERAKPDETDALARAHAEAARRAAVAESAIPPGVRLLCEYSTPEALAERMADRDGRAIVLSDEGAGVLGMTSRYSRGLADLDLLLRGYDGDPYTPDRITRRARPLHAATLTLALAAQPAAIAQHVACTPEIRERGLLARMLVMVPTPRAGSRSVRPTPASTATVAEYNHRLRSLLDIEDVRDPDGRLAPRELRMSREADDAIAALESEIEPRLGLGGDLERIGAAAGKMAGQAARIAAILHVAGHAGAAIPMEIQGETAERACAVARVSLGHALALEDLLVAPPELVGARRLTAWLQRHGQPVVTDREVLLGTRGTVALATAEDRDRALRLLERHGYIRRPAVDGPHRSGRPSPRWDVHPGWLKTPAPNSASTVDEALALYAENGADTGESEGAIRKTHTRNARNPTGSADECDSVPFVHASGESTPPEETPSPDGTGSVPPTAPPTATRRLSTVRDRQQRAPRPAHLGDGATLQRELFPGATAGEFL